MPKRAKELSALEVRRLMRAGRYAVGGVQGLYLQVRGESSRSWILNTTVGSRRRMFGLGSYPSVQLDAARDKARNYCALLESGLDPIEEQRKRRAALAADRAKAMSFREAAGAVVTIKQQEFRNQKHAAQWQRTLDIYVLPMIGHLPVDKVETGHVLKVLTPIWNTKTETATRVRQRIETIFNWAQARGYRNGSNPARWDGHLKELLPQPAKIRTIQHFKSLPYGEIPVFFSRLRRQKGMAAKALSFAILTVARSGEVRGARWSEVDLSAGVWTVPASRMKANKEHRVPLSPAASGLLAGLPRFAGSDLLFPSSINGKLSDTSLLAVCQRMKVEAVPHGFRSSFKTWSEHETAFPREVIEACLAHTPQNAKLEAAYQRGDLLEKRRRLMEDWARFCGPGFCRSENV